MRRPLFALLAIVSFGTLAGAVQALGITPRIPLTGSAPEVDAAAATRPAGVAVRGGRVVVNTTADRPDVDAGDGRCAGPKGFCTLRAAVMEANANDELKRITLSRRTYTLRIEGGGEDRARRGDLDVRRSLTIAGRGALIRGGGVDRVIDVARGARLSISRLRIAGGAPPAGESGGAIRSAGRLVLAHVKIVKSAVTGDGAAGGGIYNDGGSLLLTTSQVNHNSAAAGGAIAADGGTTLLRTSSLLVNEAGSGGELHVGGDGTADLRGSWVERNRAGDVGGGIAITAAAAVSVDGTAVTGNAAAGKGGGGAYVGGGSLRFDAGTISENHADGSVGAGGAVLNDNGRVVVDGSDLRRNAAAGGGGAVAAIAGTTSLAHLQVVENSGGSGGGLHLSGAGRLQLDSSVLQWNRAAVSGGALWAGAGGTAAVTGTTYVVVNSAAGTGPEDGGGAIFNDGASITVDGGPLSGNTAPGAAAAGGAILNRSGTLVIRDADVSRNSAARAGGGIAVIAGSVSVGNCIIDENAAARGGGVHVGTGSVTIGGDRGSRISSNRAGQQGGGIWNSPEGITRITRTNMISNRAPSGPERFNAGPAAAFTIDGAPA